MPPKKKLVRKVIRRTRPSSSSGAEASAVAAPPGPGAAELPPPAPSEDASTVPCAAASETVAVDEVPMAPHCPKKMGVETLASAAAPCANPVPNATVAVKSSGNSELAPKKKIVKIVRRVRRRVPKTKVEPHSAPEQEQAPAVSEPLSAVPAATPEKLVVPELETKPQPASNVALIAPAAACSTNVAEIPGMSERMEQPAAGTSDPTPKPGTRRVRKVVKKIIVRRVPKGTLAAKKAAAESMATDSLTQLEPGRLEEQRIVKKPEMEGENNAITTSKRFQEQENEESAVLSLGKKTDLGRDILVDVKETRLHNDEEVNEMENVTAEGLGEKEKKRKAEIFISGLHKEAKEDEIWNVFSKAGEIVELRLMKDEQIGKNKGHCYIRYREPSQAKKAITELAKVEIHGKLCGTESLESKDTIFLGNIVKRWKKDDIVKLLQDNGVENVNAVTLLSDPDQPGCNRGFAFLEFESNSDAESAFRKLKRKNAFGTGQNVTVAWSETLNHVDEEAMQKVKSLFVEGIPSSWDQTRLERIFKKFGKIERVVMSRDLQSTKRKDFAFVNYTTREAALSCLKSFDKEVLVDKGSKVNIKVSLAKPTKKIKRDKGEEKSNMNKHVKPKKVNSDVGTSAEDISSKLNHRTSDRRTTYEPLHVLRDQAPWKGHGSHSKGPAISDYAQSLYKGKRPYINSGSISGGKHPYMDSYDARGYPRQRLESSSYSLSNSSHNTLRPLVGGSLQPYLHHSQSAIYPAGTQYDMAGYTDSIQRQAGPSPYSGRLHQRY